jgi:hypothetical protein
VARRCRVEDHTVKRVSGATLHEDVMRMADDLSRLPLAVELGRATRAVITQNLVLALAVIAGPAVASLVGATRIGGAIVLTRGARCGRPQRNALARPPGPVGAAASPVLL